MRVLALLLALPLGEPTHSASAAEAPSALPRAPELDGLAWLNTDRPLRIHQELKGHVVLLDFWTYCCINYIHILPDLAYLERKYANQPFVVVGVHSAKFTNEAVRENIRAAILRYEIEHPVVVDDQMKLWRAYSVDTWPTFWLIDPEGNPFGSLKGEGQRATLDREIGKLLRLHRRKGTLAKARIELVRETMKTPASGLLFPGKVLADATGRRLFISDSNHNRIVVTTWPDENGRAKLLKVVGDGQAGARGGAADRARFDHPQGMALHDDRLYVADTENHLIRAIRLDTWVVASLAGNQKRSWDRSGGRSGRRQGIASPWGLAVDDTSLYIAMAGPHQLWRLALKGSKCEALVGSGKEDIVDGAFGAAALAQPSGLALVGKKLFFADSEVSAIREADLERRQVRTIIGKGLFDFGDVDGSYPDARLQHCLGVTAYGDKLLVADTYNHKIKLIDPAQSTSRTFLGTGEPGTGRGSQLAFFEPGGLHYAGDTLFIADTNNHRILRVDPKTKKWAVVTITGLTAPAAPK